MHGVDVVRVAVGIVWFGERSGLAGVRFSVRLRSNSGATNLLRGALVAGQRWKRKLMGKRAPSSRELKRGQVGSWRI